MQGYLNKLGTIGLLGFVAPFFFSCSSSSDVSPASSIPGPPSGQAAPSLAELQDELSKAFASLGIDPDKVPAAAPSGTNNAVFDLSAELIDPDGEGDNPPTGVQLVWTERMLGDYDANGEVASPDLIPISQHWEGHVDYDDPVIHDGLAWWPTGDPCDGATGTENWLEARVDGDANTEIRSSDIVTIAQHWSNTSSGYLIERAVNYGTGELAWEEQPLDLGDGAWPSAPRSLLTGNLLTTPARYSVTVPLTGAELGLYFRVRAYDAASQTSGDASNTAHVSLGGVTDTVPPYWLDTVGVTSLIPAPEQITVDFGTAIDEDSPPVRYRVYWAEGDSGQPDAPFDYGTANTVETDAAPYIITGLTDGTYYRAAVRAVDSATTPNEELNTVVLGREAGAADIYPPEWQGEPGIQDVFFGSDSVILFWNQALDNHTDEYGTWSSFPVVYRVYIGDGHLPDWNSATTYDFTENGDESYVVPLYDIDTSVSHWYAVRARDASSYPNEDLNTVFLSTPGIQQDYITFPSISPEISLSDVSTSNYLRQSSNQLHSQFFISYKSSSSTDYWIERIPVEFPLASNRELFHFDDLGRGVLDYFVNDDGSMSFIFEKYIGLFEGSYAGYYNEYDDELVLTTVSGDIDKVGFDHNSDPFILATKYEYDGPITITSIEQYLLSLPTEDKYVFNHVTGSDVSNIIDHKYNFYSSFAVLNSGVLRIPTHPLSDIGSLYPQDILLLSGEDHTFLDGPVISYPEALYASSYGYNIDSAIDYYLTSDAIHRIQYFSTNDIIIKSQIPEGLEFCLPDEPVVVDIDHILCSQEIDTYNLYDSNDEIRVFYTLTVYLDGIRYIILASGLDDITYPYYCFTDCSDIILGVKEEGSPILSGYQYISLDF